MPLTLHRHDVSAVRFGTAGLDDHVLTVDEASVRDRLAADERLSSISVSLARPGDDTRVLCVKDVVQPRIRKSGGDVLGVLDGVAVATCGPIVGFQEGVIDMSGPGAAYTPFSQLHLVVLELAVRDGLTPHDHEKAVRAAGLTAAEIVAEVCVGAAPERTETIARDALPADSGLPRIAYVYMVLSQGLLHDTYVFGRDAKAGLPVIADPARILDNGVVSGNCVSACDKTTTYHHQNNPMIAELLRGHGSRWDFAGTVITNAPVRLGDKRASAEAAVALVREMGADGAVVSKEGFGNPDADLMMLVRGLERVGIATVGITDEFAGTDGGSQSLADTTPEADAIVSTGNANQRLVLPPMTTVIGPPPDLERLAGGYPHSLRQDGSLEVELQAIMGATNELGFGRLTCRTV